MVMPMMSIGPVDMDMVRLLMSMRVNMRLGDARPVFVEMVAVMMIVGMGMG